jgi:SAM-dependent methyltransferase
MDANAWDERYREKDFVWSLEPNVFFAEATAGLAPGRALDLAAGEGRNAIWLAQRGWRVTAVDWSDVAIVKGRELAAHHDVEIDWVVADLLDWVPPAGEYDLVAVIYLQVPSPQRERLWRNAAGAVAPGGRLVVVGHDLANLEHGYGGPQSPEVLYTASGVAAVIGEGLEIEQAETVLRPVETPDGVETAIDNLTVAVRAATRP